MPQEPAVGAATILPMQALLSAMANARAHARPARAPSALRLPSTWRSSFGACPPVMPDIERRFSSMPCTTDSRMT